MNERPKTQGWFDQEEESFKHTPGKWNIPIKAFENEQRFSEKFKLDGMVSPGQNRFTVDAMLDDLHGDLNRPPSRQKEPSCALGISSDEEQDDFPTDKLVLTNDVPNA